MQITKALRFALIFFAGFAAGIVTTYHLVLYQWPEGVVV